MMTAPHRRPAPSGDYVVPDPPRAGDAIGDALRGLYGGNAPVPEAMAAMLAKLDRVGRA